MSQVNTQMCERPQCQKLRMKDANHWLHGHQLDGGGFILLPFGRIAVLVSEDNRSAGNVELSEETEGAAHLCGQECGIWWVQQQVSMMTSRELKSRSGD